MIGTYYRLSLADEDVSADKAESNSIQGQRGLVEGYIMARPELATEPRQEYVDDGYSGTSTSRPAFQRLIQDAQDGKVKTIIVKDFSRFARDYIEAGDYMERIFPLLGVRFISVNDGYDSGMQAGNDVRGLEAVSYTHLHTPLRTSYHQFAAKPYRTHSPYFPIPSCTLLQRLQRCLLYTS